MKNLSILLSIVLITVLSFNIGCKKDEDPTLDQTPTLTFVGGAGYTDEDVTFGPGQVFRVGINASANENSGSKIASFLITRTCNNVAITVLDSTDINESTFEYDDYFGALLVDGTERWSFKVTDKAGETKELSFTITTVSYDSITTYTAVLLGGQSSDTGSYFSTSNGNVYTQSLANANSSLIDMIYYYGSTNNATICAPNDVTVNGGSGNLSLATGLTTKNATLFAATLVSTTDFDAMINDSLIHVATVGGLTATKMTQLATGDVFAFETADGKLGLVKVGTIAPSSNGYIFITVKMEE